MNTVSDHLDYGLTIIFIGFNPSLRSGEVGHHYANPRNNFWRILHQSGLTPRLYDASEDGELLKLGYGFTNIVARPTRGRRILRARNTGQDGRRLGKSCRNTDLKSPAMSAKAYTPNSAAGRRRNGACSPIPLLTGSAILWLPLPADWSACPWGRLCQYTGSCTGWFPKARRCKPALRFTCPLNE